MRQFGPILIVLNRLGVSIRWEGWYGIGIHDHRVLPPLYSERNRPGKLARYWHIGPWCFRLFLPQVPQSGSASGSKVDNQEEL